MASAICRPGELLAPCIHNNSETNNFFFVRDQVSPKCCILEINFWCRSVAPGRHRCNSLFLSNIVNKDPDISTDMLEKSIPS